MVTLSREKTQDPQPAINRTGAGNLGVTMLSPRGGNVRKTITISPRSGMTVVETIDPAWAFSAEIVSLSSPEDFGDLIARLIDSNIQKCLILGTPTATFNGGVFYRQHHHIDDQPRRLIPVDIDGFRLRDGLDWTEDGVQPAVEQAIHALLPEAFQNASYTFALTASCGARRNSFKEKAFIGPPPVGEAIEDGGATYREALDGTTLSVRLFFFSSRPLRAVEMKGWLGQVRGIDPSIYNKAQCIYFARPIRKNHTGVDPLDGHQLTGFVQGDDDFVDPPEPGELERFIFDEADTSLHAASASSNEEIINKLAWLYPELWLFSTGAINLRLDEKTQSFRCVASWRDSMSGRDLYERAGKVEINFQKRVIIDRANGHTFTPIRFVAKLTSRSQSEAASFLLEKLRDPMREKFPAPGPAWQEAAPAPAPAPAPVIDLETIRAANEPPEVTVYRREIAEFDNPESTAPFSMANLDQVQRQQDLGEVTADRANEINLEFTAHAIDQATAIRAGQTALIEICRSAHKAVGVRILSWLERMVDADQDLDQVREKYMASADDHSRDQELLERLGMLGTGAVRNEIADNIRQLLTLAEAIRDSIKRVAAFNVVILNDGPAGTGKTTATIKVAADRGLRPMFSTPTNALLYSTAQAYGGKVWPGFSSAGPDNEWLCQRHSEGEALVAAGGQWVRLCGVAEDQSDWCPHRKSGSCAVHRMMKEAAEWPGAVGFVSNMLTSRPSENMPAPAGFGFLHLDESFHTAIFGNELKIAADDLDPAIYRPNDPGVIVGHKLINDIQKLVEACADEEVSAAAYEANCALAAIQVEMNTAINADIAALGERVYGDRRAQAIAAIKAAHRKNFKARLDDATDKIRQSGATPAKVNSVLARRKGRVARLSNDVSARSRKLMADGRSALADFVQLLRVINSLQTGGAHRAVLSSLSDLATAAASEISAILEKRAKELMTDKAAIRRPFPVSQLQALKALAEACRFMARDGRTGRIIFGEQGITVYRVNKIDQAFARMIIEYSNATPEPMDVLKEMFTTRWSVQIVEPGRVVRNEDGKQISKGPLRKRPTDVDDGSEIELVKRTLSGETEPVFIRAPKYSVTRGENVTVRVLRGAPVSNSMFDAQDSEKFGETFGAIWQMIHDCLMIGRRVLVTGSTKAQEWLAEKARQCGISDDRLQIIARGKAVGGNDWQDFDDYFSIGRKRLRPEDRHQQACMFADHWLPFIAKRPWSIYAPMADWDAQRLEYQNLERLRTVRDKGKPVTVTLIVDDKSAAPGDFLLPIKAEEIFEWSDRNQVIKRPAQLETPSEAAIRTMLERGEWISSRRYLEREFNLTERAARKIAEMAPPEGWVEKVVQASKLGGKPIKMFFRK